MKRILSFGVFIVLALLAPSCDDGGGRSEKVADEKPVVQVGLKSLKVDPGQLDPVFSADTLSYEVTVDGSLDGITVAACPSQGCTASIGGEALVPEDYSAVVSLTEDSTLVTVSAAAEGMETREYRITITKIRQNPVSNWSFEEFDTVDDVYIPRNWTVIGTSSDFIVSTEVSRDGSYAARFFDLTGTIAGREVLSDPVAIDPLNDLTIITWILLPEGNPSEAAGAGFKVYYFTDEQCLVPCTDADGKNITYTKNKVSPKEMDIWEQVSSVRTAADIPADAAYIRIGLRACYNGAKGGTKDNVLYFDSVTVTQQE